MRLHHRSADLSQPRLGACTLLATSPIPNSRDGVRRTELSGRAVERGFGAYERAYDR
jgi:hypothetical protein